ncbi:Ulp1-like peptidase [Cucumis melo var. makuwa]|uniref:Ulp1-like peptidase n=1 Tax=Cucumis melo var. makuwa TaxID=1194695 RepID=A0A5D3C271_CUCMM|nr:Ulp1-like peptidase [Cucumis melo var. makuwa]TYK05384.1 Ulp1-like peptidase [Cucumis melo var. makuwa]
MTSTSTDGPLYKINPSHHFYALVEDEGKDYISFLLEGVVCTFGRREFNIITGLWGPKEESIQLVGNSRLLEKFFKDNECIYVWAYESIPTIIGCGVDKVNDDAIPRMLRWVCQQSPKSQTISQVFDSSMLIIKAVIEMTPEEEQLKITSGDFKKSKKQKSKSNMKKAIQNLQDRVAVVERQLTSIKSDIDELKGMMSTILKHIGLQRKGDEGDCKGFEGLVDHTLESKEVDNAKTKDVDTGGTPNWLRMSKEDDTSNGAKHIELKKKGDEDVHTVGTPPWLRFNIELQKSIDVLEKKVEIGLKEPIDVVDDEVEIEDSGKKLHTHFDLDVTEIEPFLTQRPHV